MPSTVGVAKSANRLASDNVVSICSGGLKMAGVNAVQQLVLAIDVCLEKGLVAPMLALVYAGIDAMAWLGLPDDQHDVTSGDFIQ